MPNLRKVSFGGTAAIVTSMGLIIGLNAATAAPSAIVGSLLIVGIADNLTDSLSVHIYQESERMAEREAFRTTVANFIARVCVTLTFVIIVGLLPPDSAPYAALAWGFFLLSGLSHSLPRSGARARSRKSGSTEPSP
jgi:hypothetical protein